MTNGELSRRDFLKAGFGVALGTATETLTLDGVRWPSNSEKALVSIVKVKKDRIGIAVEEATDLLGGIETVAKGKERIMLKPNLIAESPDFTTKPDVIKTLARQYITLVMQPRSGLECLASLKPLFGPQC